MNQVKVLLIGVGGYGAMYLKALHENDLQADIVGICEIRQDLWDRFPFIKEKKIPVYPNVADFYAKDTADLAIISTPVHTHKALSLACLERGTNVLCEKPLCLTMEEAFCMQKAAEKAHRFLSVGYQLNYRRDVLALKQDILSGRFGAPKKLGILQAFRRGENYYARNNWAGKIMQNGIEVFDSPFSNASAHNFQMMTFLLGSSLRTSCDVQSLEANLYKGNPHVENYDICALRFASSCGATLCYYTAHPIEKDIEPKGIFEFEEGTITFDSWLPSFRARMKNGVEIDYSKVAPGDSIQKLRDAIEAVQNGGEPVCGVAADFGHIMAVRLSQQKPILPVRDSLRTIYQEEGDTFTKISGVSDVFEKCLPAFALPSEMGLALD